VSGLLRLEDKGWLGGGGQTSREGGGKLEVLKYGLNLLKLSGLRGRDSVSVVGRELKGPGLLEAGGGSRCGHPRNGNSGFGHSGGGADNTLL